MNNPRKSINKNVRFYFTEAGWEKYSRDTFAACLRTGQAISQVMVREWLSLPASVACGSSAPWTVPYGS